MNLLEFPLVPLTDIPARLRLLAEQIDDGELGDVTNIICVIETDETVRSLAIGQDGDQIRSIGLLHFAAANLCGDDE